MTAKSTRTLLSFHRTMMKAESSHTKRSESESKMISYHSKMSDDESSFADGDDEDDSESDDDSSRSSSFSASDVPESATDADVELRKMAKKEADGIRMWSLVMLIILVITGVIVSAATYLFLKNKTDNDFQNSFVLFANTIQDATEFHVRNMFEGIGTLSETLTARALASSQTFPFVTIAMFEVYAEHARQQAGVDVLAYGPLITSQQQAAWLTYVNANLGWIDQSVAIQAESNATTAGPVFYSDNITISPSILMLDPSGNRTEHSSDSLLAPTWMVSPPPGEPNVINVDLFSIPNVPAAVLQTRESLYSRIIPTSFETIVDVTDDNYERETDLLGALDGTLQYDSPHSYLISPVFSSLDAVDASVAGLIAAIVHWDTFLVDLVPDSVDSIVCVLKNSCYQTYTYQLAGKKATLLGEGDLHDFSFDHMNRTIPLNRLVNAELASDTEGHCEYVLIAYPTEAFQSEYSSNIAVVFTLIVALTFMVMTITFILYDRYVQKRNTKIVNEAARSNAIVSSLFPSNVRERLLDNKAKNKDADNAFRGTKSKIKSFLDGDVGSENFFQREDPNDSSKPIADLFPETTIMFADIAGFTAWSSVREPAQVFILLETIYRAFDESAKKRRVFKVETVGDCYVAVTGIPDPRKDHAVAMARFARDCMRRVNILTKKLEVTLGPDTGDLAMRIGIHSGPVTAGVLRGERSRFQLFGDTMNTAARMESNGKKGRIQVSQDCADLIIGAGKKHWLTPRQDKIHAKGKGEMQTYWLSTSRQVSAQDSNTSIASGTTRSFDTSLDSRTSSRRESDSSILSFAVVDDDDDDDEMDGETVINMVCTKTSRLIDWNVEVLSRVLKQVIARRQVSEFKSMGVPDTLEKKLTTNHGASVLDEVKEIITLPKFDAAAAAKQDLDSVELDEQVVEQLREYVTNIAVMYRDNPFHNFEHASHVAMSVVKLLSRIVAPSDLEHIERSNDNAAVLLHDHTYGITSDPLTQFACIFSALIHDCDHSGVPNTTLVKENTKIARYYKGKSVAEQNSVDIAWDLLMDKSYAELRGAIYSTVTEMKRFRQLVVNSVMATDIVDKELKALRNARWEKAFSGATRDENPRDTVNRKATIVIEHLIQASDVAHTMQHWHIYRKWNEMFFRECYLAFKKGRADTNPADTWYEGEIGFFDFYIIPLAKKLKECGVFGVSSDEYLNYAIKNRQEWEDRGREVVDEMVSRLAECDESNSGENTGDSIQSKSSKSRKARAA